jgi:hypothetical protein
MLRDTSTKRLDAFLETNVTKLLVDTRAKSIRNRLSVIPHNHLDENPGRILQNLGALTADIQSLCTQHDFARFLILFRKLPHGVASRFIRETHDPGLDLALLFAAAYPEAVLFGTNCILKYCSHAPTLRSNKDRYTFVPTDGELMAAAQVFLLCVLHRCELFYMNSVIRRDLVDSTSLAVLLNVYNERLTKRWMPVPRGTMADTIILPASVDNLTSEERLWRFRDQAGKLLVLGMRNYIPIPCDADLEFERFSYLDTEDFPALTGFSFAKFRAVWLGLNQLLINMLPPMWPDSWVAAADPDLLIARLDHADDYCETALGSGRPESIWTSCHELLARKSPADCPTEEDCRAVVEFLTYRQFDGDVRFVEQPFVFYQVSERLLLWDYYRHGGLLRCLARNFTRLPGTSATQNKKGETFERAIKAVVSSIHGVRGVRKWVYREGGRDVWDVDVGFVFKNILFLVDAKNEQKSVRYYFEAAEVSDKVSRREAFLAKLDNNLKTYGAQVRTRWQDCEPLLGAICLVCTEEAEFIAKLDSELWLKPYECPRICLLTELVDFMNQPEAVERIESNPAFVPFSK